MATPVGCILCCGAGRLPRDSLHKHKAAFRLTFLDVLKNCIQVVIETGGVGVAGSTNLINDWIGHGVASNNSSGVQYDRRLESIPAANLLDHRPLSETLKQEFLPWLSVEKVIPDLFPLGRPQETPMVSWVDRRRIRRRVLYPQPASFLATPPAHPAASAAEFPE